MRSSRSKTTLGLALMLFGALMLASGAVFAQGIPQSFAELTSGTPPDDWSMRMWRSLLGEFADNPFSTLGAPTTLLGSVFVIFNGCIFVVGFSWALYGIMSGVVGTAHEGEVLGKRMSTIWFPIRMVTGIAGMVPIFGGFTMNQAVMMFLTTIGIGVGNLMWTGAVNNTAQFQGLMNNQAFSPAAVPDARVVARNMFAANVCNISEAELASRMGITDQNHIPEISSTASAADGTSSYLFGTRDDPTKCGQASVKSSPNWMGGMAGDYRNGSNMLAFRSGAIDYKAIENASVEAQITALTRMQNEVQTLATQWYAQRTAALAEGSAVPVVPMDAIEQAGRNFVNGTAADMARRYEGTTSAEAIKASARENMLSVGWFGAGAWFSTFAEANAALADAAKAVKLESKFNIASKDLSSGTSEVLETLSLGYDAADAKRNGGADGDSSRALLDSAIKDTCDFGSSNGSMVGTATGNCSLGQGIVSAAIRASAIGSGGGGDGGGSLGFDSQGLVNPVIMMKNMGDYVMSFSSTVIHASWFAGAAAKAVSGAADAVSSVPGIGKPIAGLVKGGADAVASSAAVIKTFAVIALVVGAAMAIYIPMIPFITWIGAILAYAASMIEGLAGATLHSMAHLDSEGEGMGQRTAHGYMFYINAVARPGLMIIGFFFASAVMISVGTLQAQMFLPAMANVQGNSLTGFFSIIMFLVIFFVMNLTLITTSFNLIYVITDQVIGFVGGQVGQKLGQDTEDKANNMFLMAARVGPSAMGQVAQAKGAADKAKGASAAQAGATPNNSSAR